MDPDYIALLFDRHAAALELYAAQWTVAPADVVQEAFIALARQNPPPERIVPWLYRTVRNGAISAARSANRRQRHEASFAATAARSGGVWFEDSVENEIDSASATEALQSLPAEEREAVIAKIWGGLTYEEIAEITNSSRSTAHRRYEAGLSRIRERLDHPCPNENTSLKS